MRQYKVLLFILLLSILTSSCQGGEDSELSSSSASDETSYVLSEDVASEDATSEDATSEDATSEDATSEDDSVETFTAVYGGVQNFGSSALSSSNKDTFKYVFTVDGKRKIFTVDNGMLSGGQYSYDIQNVLKRGYTYEITVEDGKVTSAKEIITASSQNSYTPPVSGEAGVKTIENLLSTAMMPVGTSLYIYGGGWNWQDAGSSVQATSIGLSSSWYEFFQSQTASFEYKSSNNAKGYFPYGQWNEYYYAGLDCSGYVGWTIYNTLNTESGKEGYVMSAQKMAKSFADKGWGIWSNSAISMDSNPLLPGDIISKKGHVYICVGTCSDGSSVILHSTPSLSRLGKEGGGVQLSAIGKSEQCEAYVLADYYMKNYFPDWYDRYPVSLKDFDEYTSFSPENAGIFTWNGSVLTDPDGIRSMSANEVLELIFKNAGVSKN